MRVLQVLHSMVVGGAEVLVHDFVRATQGEACQAIVCLDDVGQLGHSLRDAGIPVDLIGRKGGVEPRVVFAMRRAIERFRPDVILAHQYTPYSYAAMALPFVRPRPGLVFLEHGRHYPDVRRPKRVAANRLFLQWTDRVAAVSGYVKRLLVENEGIAADRIEVVYNGVDPSRFEGPFDRDAARTSLGLAPGDLAVACIARIHPVKDHPTLLRAFAHARARVPEAKLLVVGGGETDGLRGLAQALGIAESVTFTGVRRDVPEVFAAIDLFAMTSLSEGTSVTILEAMLSRRAVVVTDVGGNPEVVERDVTGLLAPRGDDRALGDAMAELLLDPARRAAMGERGRARVLGHFTRERMHRAWLGMLADSCRRRAP